MLGKKKPSKRMKYEDRVIAFIDILGFKNIVDKTLVDEKDASRKIWELSDVLLLFRRILGDEPIKYKSHKLSTKFAKSKRITQFSDLIVISFLINEESEVFYTLADIQTLLVNLVYRGILCRGGITYGKLIHTPNLIFGPGLIQAYETESKAALYPRIILGEEVIRIAEKYHGFQHTAKYEREYILSIVTKDTDDMYFIDYFDKVYGELDDPVEDMPEYIDKLREVIMSNMRSDMPDLKVKYGWLRNKFNRIVRHMKDPRFIGDLRRAGDDDIADYYEDLKSI